MNRRRVIMVVAFASLTVVLRSVLLWVLPSVGAEALAEPLFTVPTWPLVAVFASVALDPEEPTWPVLPIQWVASCIVWISILGSFGSATLVIAAVFALGDALAAWAAVTLAMIVRRKWPGRARSGVAPDGG